MRINVALDTLWKSLVKGSTVRLTVTLGTGQNLTVLGMAFGTSQSAVLCDPLLQVLVGSFMAGTAHLIGCVHSVRDASRRVNRVTGQTLRHPLTRDMRLMANTTVGHVSMPVLMTSSTSHFSVFTGATLQLCHRPRMTLNALALYGNKGNVFGSMRVHMTFATLGDRLPVGQFVAGLAFGHDLSPVLFLRAVNVILSMALGAQHPSMLSP